MSQIIPFDFNSQLPAHLRGSSNINDDVLAYARTGMTSMSVKGKTFTIVKGDDRTMVMNPKDPESPASNIEVAIVRIQKGFSKAFYPNGYTEGGEAEKPQCFSHDGTTPDKTIEKPVCSSCAACPKNVFGSKIGDNGKKQKACSDSIRVAIAAPDSIDEPMLLRVPPASIKPLQEHVKFVAKKGVDYNKVITKISFDKDSPTPLLVFTPIGFANQETCEAINEAFDSDQVQNILGSNSFHIEHAAPNDPAKPDEKFEQATEVITKAKATPKPAAPKIASKDKTVTEAEVLAAVEQVEAKPVQKAAPAVVDLDDIDLDGLNFDD
jgi:hypothetical protein